ADGSPRERRDVTRERRNEPVADPLGPPLEDEAPHLALGALRQLVDRSQRLPEPVVGAVVLERLLRRAGVQHAREERLRNRVVQLAGDAAALLQATLLLPPLRLRELLGRATPLGDDRAQEQRRQGRDEHVELSAEGAVGDRLLVERR